MLEKYQEAILLINDLLSEPGKENEIEILRKEIEELEMEIKNDWRFRS